MNKQSGQWLLLTVFFLLLPPMATAQKALPKPGPHKQSHRDLPILPELANPQEMMAQRLQELRQLHQWQDKVRELLQDPDFRKRVQNQFSPEDLRQLWMKISKDQGLGQDDNWKRLLEQASLGQKLNQQHIDKLLHQWHNYLKGGEGKLRPSSGFDSIMPDPTNLDAATQPSILHPEFTPSPPAFPTLTAPEPSLLERMQEDTTNWLMENLDGVAGDAIEALTQAGTAEEGAPFAELLRSLRQHDFSGISASGPAAELSRHLANAGSFLNRHGGAWDEARSLFRAAPLPSLPRFDPPSISAPSSAAADSDGWTAALLSFLMLGATVFLLCKWGIVPPARLGAGEEWRLGPWPVPPGRVSTRQDVVCAFEHLALLCLGPAAAVCHHRDLAQRLAEQDSGNPRRRQAAEMLSLLYEQSRYAPAGEALSQGQLTDARHALCFLAGVTAV